MKYFAILALLGVSAVQLEHHHNHVAKRDDHSNRQIFGYNLAQGDGEVEDCVPLEISAKKMKYEMENFSRTFDVKHYNNAVLIA